MLSPPPPLYFPAAMVLKVDDEADDDEWLLLSGEWSSDGVEGCSFNDNGKGSMEEEEEALSFKFRLAILEEGGSIGVGLIGLATLSALITGNATGPRPIGKGVPGMPP